MWAECLRLCLPAGEEHSDEMEQYQAISVCPVLCFIIFRWQCLLHININSDRE